MKTALNSFFCSYQYALTVFSDLFINKQMIKGKNASPSATQERLKVTRVFCFGLCDLEHNFVEIWNSNLHVFKHPNLLTLRGNIERDHQRCSHQRKYIQNECIPVCYLKARTSESAGSTAASFIPDKDICFIDFLFCLYFPIKKYGLYLLLHPGKYCFSTEQPLVTYWSNLLKLM